MKITASNKKVITESQLRKLIRTILQEEENTTNPKSIELKAMEIKREVYEFAETLVNRNELTKDDLYKIFESRNNIHEDIENQLDMSNPFVRGTAKIVLKFCELVHKFENEIFHKQNNIDFNTFKSFAKRYDVFSTIFIGKSGDGGEIFNDVVAQYCKKGGKKLYNRIYRTDGGIY
jgi:hypothetical protein